MENYVHVHPDFQHLFLLSDADRVFACAADIWVPHPSGEALLNKMEFMMKMSNKIVAPSLVCLANPGVGKTSTIEQMKRRNIHSENKIIFVTMHQNPNGYGLKDLILTAMGLGVGRRARQGADITPEMQFMIKSERIKAIVIDEVHDAVTLTPMQQRINLSLLKNLSGNTYGLSVFAFGIPEAAKVLRADPQLARRYAVHSLANWENGDDFRNFVCNYIRRLPLKLPTDFKDQLLLLKINAMAKGITDNIVKILHGAAMAAIIDKTEHITHLHIDKIVPILADFGQQLQDPPLLGSMDSSIAR